MHSLTLYSVILSEWLCEVCVSYVQRPRTKTQSVYTILGNLMQKYVLLSTIMLLKHFSDLKV